MNTPIYWIRLLLTGGLVLGGLLGFRLWLGQPVPTRLSAGTAALLPPLANTSPATLRVISLWATWCWPCLQEMPQLDSLAGRYRGRVVFQAITSEPEELVRKFQAKRAPIRYMEVVSRANGVQQELFTYNPDPELRRAYVIPTLLVLRGTEVVYYATGSTLTTMSRLDSVLRINALPRFN